MTYIPGGRLGNKMSAFLMLLWLKLDFGFDVYYPKDDYEVRKWYFSFWLVTVVRFQAYRRGLFIV